MLPSPRLLFHTLRHLKPVQIYYRVWFKFYSPVVKDTPVPSLRSLKYPWVEGAQPDPFMFSEDQFVFLNCEGWLRGTEDWNNPEYEKLWLYHLHYFDDLNAKNCPSRSAWHRNLIQRWILENPQGQGNGWEPYALSMRIVNWIKWANQGNEMESEWLQSLATQTRYLRRRIEYHLQANHLLANAKALVFAGLYYSGDEAEGWLEQGLGILERQVPEQILDDGGHFELSPMYHSLILTDFLDIINLAMVYGYKHALINHVIPDCVERMWIWLKTMSHPDGGISFFNDATFGVSPTLAEIKTYGERLGFDLPLDTQDGCSALEQSGYMRLQKPDLVALLDVGDVGPDYQPGHAHADTLSFELSLFGQRIFVNSGISCYGVSNERTRQRRTESHNTVVVNREDSSEVWGGFRVARRAHPFGLTINENSDITVSCAHDGYRRLKGKPVHRRKWRLSTNCLDIEDVVEGKYEEAVACFYLHPNLVVEAPDNGNNGVIRLPSNRTVCWSVSGGKAEITESLWYPGFGQEICSQLIRIYFDQPDIRFSLSWE